MPKITQIQKIDSKVAVYIDGAVCMFVRSNVWEYMNLHEGSEITYVELKQKEAFYWKKACMLSTGDRERERVAKVVRWIAKHLLEVEIKIVKSGGEAGIPNPNMEPNLSLLLKGTTTEVIAIMVRGMDIEAGTGHWISLDAIEHIQKNPEHDIWIASCFKYPESQITWIKLNRNKDYRNTNKSEDNFIFFDKQASECHPSRSFCGYVKNKIRKNNK